MKTELLQVKIEKELLDELRKLAKSNFISMSAQIRLLIVKELKNGKEEK